MTGRLAWRGQLTKDVDPTTPFGRHVLRVLASLAELERDLIAQRFVEVHAAAQARGRMGGRPRVDELKIEAARKLVEGGMSAAQAARAVGIGRATLYRYGIGVTNPYETGSRDPWVDLFEGLNGEPQ